MMMICLLPSIFVACLFFFTWACPLSGLSLNEPFCLTSSFATAPLPPPPPPPTKKNQNGKVIYYIIFKNYSQYKNRVCDVSKE